MSEQHFDEYEHYNYDQDKAMYSGHSGKQRSKKEAAMNTNHHNPGGHERKIVTKLQNAEKNAKESKKWIKVNQILDWSAFGSLVYDCLCFSYKQNQPQDEVKNLKKSLWYGSLQK